MTSIFSTRSVALRRWSARPVLVLARRLAVCSLAIGLVLGVAGGSVSSAATAAATSKDKALFVAVGNSYSAAVTEFNLVIASFSACTGPKCVGAAIEGLGDTRFYQATSALEKKAPYPSGVSKDLFEYVGNLVSIQKDINSVAKAKTTARQKTIVTETLEIDVDNLAFRGMHILIYLGELKQF